MGNLLCQHLALFDLFMSVIYRAFDDRYLYGFFLFAITQVIGAEVDATYSVFVLPVLTQKKPSERESES